jgi:hypothetical protein
MFMDALSLMMVDYALARAAKRLLCGPNQHDLPRRARDNRS